MSDDVRESRGGESPGPKRDPGFSLAGEVARLTAENKELARQLAKAPPAGPAMGAPVCFRRGTETVFRAARLISDGYVDSVPHPAGPVHFALIEYGDPAGAPVHMAKVNGQEVAAPHGFQTNRPHDPVGGPDSWHVPSECPCGHDPARCPYADGPGLLQAP